MRYAPRARVAPGTVRVVEAYGPRRLQRGQWWLPPDRSGPLPAVVMLHGGFWRPGFGRSLQDAVAADLAGRGLLVWNVDYRAADAGWPATLLDVALAHDHLVRGRFADRVDPTRTAVVGHSAGGHLALWLAARHRLPIGAPGAGGVAPVPALAVGQAPVAALARAARAGLGDGAVTALVGGGPDEVPERYRPADPIALLPTGVPTVLLHSDADAQVPVWQSQAYAEAGGGRLVRVPGDHFAHLDPRSEAVARLRDALTGL